MYFIVLFLSRLIISTNFSCPSITRIVEIKKIALYQVYIMWSLVISSLYYVVLGYIKFICGPWLYQ